MSGKPFKLALPAERYITQSSCGKGYYRLAFIGYKVNLKDPKMLGHKKQLPMGVIFGTPFLEQYPTTFKMDHPPKLIFYDARKALCQIKSKD